MPSELKPDVQSGGAGLKTADSSVAAGQSPTAAVAADATQEFRNFADIPQNASAPPVTEIWPAKPAELSGTEVTQTLHPGTASAAAPTDNLALTTALPIRDPAETPAKVPAGALPANRKIGPYVVLRELGRGGMGVVYLARHETLGRVVALKMILAGNHAGEEARQRFLVEAQSIARMSHPGVVTVYDIGEHEGMPYFSLEYIPGNSLSKLISEKPLEAKGAASLVAKMASAMQYAHERGVLHRDLKPANVLMADEETPKITDFGLAKQIEGAQEAELTQSGAIMGTPSYMSPEQASGDPAKLGPATDQYSLGAMLYHVLTGRAPFVAPRAFDVIRQVLTDDPVAPRKLAPQVPADLETICLKTLQKDPARRYASCQELAADLERFLDGRPIAARPISPQERLVRWCRRNPVIAGTSGIAIAATLLVFAVISWAAYSLSLKNGEIQEAYTKLEGANTELKSTNVALDERRKEVIGANLKLEKVNSDLTAANVVAEERRKDAVAATKQAYQRAQLANSSFQLIIDNVRTALASNPQFRDLRKNLILAAAEGLEKLPDDPSDTGLNPGLQKARLAEYLYVTYMAIGEPSKALPHIEKALKILQDRNRAQGGTDATRFNLAACLLAKAQARQSVDRDMDLSMQLSGEAVALLDSVLAAPKPKEFSLDDGSKEPLDVRQQLLKSRNIHTATLWSSGRISEALQNARRNVEILDDTFNILPQLKDLPPEQKRNVRSGMAWIYQLRAVVALRAGETDEARQQQQEALELARLSRHLSGNAWDARRALADVLGFAGDFYASQKDEAKARAAYEEAVKLARELNAQDPSSEDGRNTLNIQLIKLAGYEKTQGTGKQVELYAQALEIARQMVKADPHGQTKQVAVALSLAPTGVHEEASQIADRLLFLSKRPDCELQVDLARVFSQCASTSGFKESQSDAYKKRATDLLTKAIDQGYQDGFYLKFHPDFAPLRSDKVFTDLVQKLEPASSAKSASR